MNRKVSTSLSEETRTRITKLAPTQPGESWEDAIKRVLEIAEKKDEESIQKRYVEEKS